MIEQDGNYMKLLVCRCILQVCHDVNFLYKKGAEFLWHLEEE